MFLFHHVHLSPCAPIRVPKWVPIYILVEDQKTEESVVIHVIRYTKRSKSIYIETEVYEKSVRHVEALNSAGSQPGLPPKKRCFSVTWHSSGIYNLIYIYICIRYIFSCTLIWDLSWFPCRAFIYCIKFDLHIYFVLAPAHCVFHMCFFSINMPYLHCLPHRPPHVDSGTAGHGYRKEWSRRCPGCEVDLGNSIYIYI